MKNKHLFSLTVFFLIVVIYDCTSQTWNLTGNSGTTPATNFVGTTDNQDLIFRKNNIYSGQIRTYNTSFGYNSLVVIPGASSNTYNTVFGGSSMSSLSLTGSYNTAIGGQTLFFNTSGSNNNTLGYRALLNNLTGSNNIAIGNDAMISNTLGFDNVAIGQGAMYYYKPLNSSGGNVVIGSRAGENNITGVGNLFLGAGAGFNELGNNKLYMHNGITSSPLIYGEFDNRNLIFNVNQNISSRVSINSFTTNSPTLSSGLRLVNLNNTITPISNPSLLANKGVLSVNSSGDVILVTDQGGGIISTCTTNFQIPVSNTLGNLSCGQIFDNGASVSIGSALTNTSAITYNSAGWATLGLGSVPATGNIKLAVNGITRSVAYFATSDKKFKKDIKPIENAIEKIQAIDGKTYLWDREANKEMNFDEGGHSGFIAQDLEKVLPHLVATSQNGDKAVNYIELMPYLVEAIKEQQSLIKEQQVQIDELKNLVSDSFKKHNQDLIELENTKIISVSPNPSKDLIMISVNIDKSVQTASLQIHDLNGKLLNNLTINDRDNNINKTFQKDNFGNGTYIVSLIVNGKSIDSKKIIFN